MLKRLELCLLVLLASTIQSFANVYRYRLYLEGKPGSQPVAWTHRALEHRQRLQIPVEETDYVVSEMYLQQLRDAGLTILSRSRWMNSVVVMLPEGTAVEQSVWTGLPFVKKVEMVTMPDPVSASPRCALKHEEEDASTMEIADTDNCTTPLREVNAYEPLYQAGFRGEGKMIAVFDGGFLRLNDCPFLKDKVVFAHNLYNPVSPESVYSGDSHGIKCMSIMGCPEEEGVCGTAQDAQYCLFCTESSEYECAIEEDMWIAAAEMVDSMGVDIISCSLGYTQFNNGLLSHTWDEIGQLTAFVSQGAALACRKGILVVISSGNKGSSSWQRIMFPSDVEEVLTIGAYTPEFQPASFTSIGFLSPYVKPDIAARGTYCCAIVPTEKGFGVSTRSQGTSFSTPLIAGLCASLWSAVPELTPAELRQVVIQSSSDYLSPTEKTGYGLPDFAVALAKARELKGGDSIERIAIEAADGGSTASEFHFYNLFGQKASSCSQGVVIRRSTGQKRILR